MPSCLPLLRRILEKTVAGRPISELCVPASDTPKAKKEAHYNRIAIDKIRQYKDVLDVNPNKESHESYQVLHDMINKLDSNMNKFVKLFIESNRDLAEFLAFHCTSQAFQAEYLKKVKEEVLARKFTIPRDPMLLAIIKEFQGTPVRYYKYEDITVEYDDERRVLQINDKSFGPIDSDKKEKIEQWSKARVISLKDL